MKQIQRLSSCCPTGPCGPEDNPGCCDEGGECC